MGMIIRPWRGIVTVESRDARTRRLLERAVARNAYTNAGAFDYAAVLAGDGRSLALSHIDTGYGGGVICACDATTGWSGSPTLDSVIFWEGSGSLKGSASSSGTSTYYHATSAGGTVVVGSSGAVEVVLRLTSRSAFDLAASYLRIYTGGGAYFQISFAAIETATGLTLADGVQTKCRIPTAAAGWSTGSGSPSWSTVGGMGIVVKAAGAPTAEVHWDQVLGLSATSWNAAAITGWTVTPGSRGQKALTSLGAAAGVVTAWATWTDAEMVGDFYLAGLYARSGATLVAAAPLSFYKAAGTVLTVTWTVTLSGG